jgi:5-formyltetrahydrofolate cyclo-ligase
MAVVDESKQAMRQQMRALRKAITDRPARSLRIWERLLAHEDVQSARRVMVFASVPGEPETDPLIEQLHAGGVETALPEDDGLDPTWPDVIVVPGLAFTSDGHRLGQGGGWYDRFLPGRRLDCTTIGVGFSTQLVDEVPTDVHDVVLDTVITD